jgi:hypothetical protein
LSFAALQKSAVAGPASISNCYSKRRLEPPLNVGGPPAEDERRLLGEEAPAQCAAMAFIGTSQIGRIVRAFAKIFQDRALQRCQLR